MTDKAPIRGDGMRELVFMLLVAIGLSGTPASAAITTSNVYCRAQPKPTSRVVARIRTGSAVTVRQRQSSWSLIARKPRDCWINSRYLSEETVSEANRHSLEQVRTASHRVARPAYHSSRLAPRSGGWGARTYRSPSKHTRTRRTPSYNYGGSCPCSGGNVCIGPRGGRYCITSGGNKRYGV